MSPSDCYAAVLTAALLGGCASAPEQIAASGAQSAPEANAAAIAVARADPNPVVVELSAADVDPGLVVTCREMLQHASNVITTRCMTADNWKRYEREEARQAAETVRRMQGHPNP
ncbi:MAG TPA: hypothetical protein VIC71_13695 [Gammaproteobacteria bacterium]